MQILGEKPTFPHHLVTIRRSHECQLDGVHSYSLAADEMGGSIVYWELDIAAKSIKEVDFVDYYKNSLRPYDYSLNTAFTAWDIERDMLAQVLLWDFSADNMIDTGHHVVYQKIEFRYGAQSCVVDHIDPGNYAPVHRGVCFAGLPGDQEGVSVRALFPRKMFLYEPFGGRKHSVHENNSWKTAPETSQLVNDPAYTKNNLYMPRVTVVELDGIVARHLRTVLKTYEDKTPTFSYCYSTFIPARRPLRFRPGERQRFDRNCIVAFGAIESLSRMYHLFVISLDTHARQHKIVIAKAYSSSVVFGWENMIDSEASKLFREALKMVKMDRPTHDCGVDCMSSLGDGVRNLYKFSKDPGLVKVIRMDESGIALTGWA